MVPPEDLKSLLKSQILSDAQNNKRVSVDRYLDENNYGGFIDKASRKKLVNFFKKVNKIKIKMVCLMKSFLVELYL